MAIQKPTPIKMIPKALISGFAIWLIYAVLSWLAPINSQAALHYHLSHSQLRLLSVSVNVPLAVIWLLAIYGATHLYEYALRIRNNQEGPGFMLLAYGVFALLGQLILSSFVGLIATYKPSLNGTVGIVSAYEAVALSLLAFGLLAYGTIKLARFVGVQKQAHTVLLISLAVTAVIGAFYISLVLKNPYRTVARDSTTRPTYGVNDTLIFLTIVPSYLVGWFAGLIALFNLLYFQSRVAGIIYRQFFRSFTLGCSLIIGISIFLQLLSQAASLGGLGLNAILLLVYILLLIFVGGYLFVARGAQKLLKLETV